MHSVAYFLGKDLAVMPQILLGPLLYGIIFTAMSANLGDFGCLYLVLLGVSFSSYSIGYIVSIATPPSLSQLVGVVVVFCMSAFDGALPTIPDLHKANFPLNLGFEHLSYLTPALKAFYDNEAGPWVPVAQSANIDMVKFAQDTFGYHPGDWGPNVGLKLRHKTGPEMLARIWAPDSEPNCGLLNQATKSAPQCESEVGDQIRDPILGSCLKPKWRVPKLGP